MSSSTESNVGDLSSVDFIQLQQYMEYSSMTVEDVMKEFDIDGKLVHYKHGEHITEEGFYIFLKTYLEVKNFPMDLCQRLFHSFHNYDQAAPAASHTANGVSLKDVSCFFFLLEDGQPSDKLKYTFKLYDKDCNGFLDGTEVDRIISQMMHAADYLGWEVTELRPVLQDMMTEIDLDRSGTVSLQEWVEGGMNNIALLVLLGLTVAQRDGQHLWRMKNFKKPTYCDFCQGMLLGLYKQGLCCTYCKYIIHGRCANKNPSPCINTFVRTKQDTGVSAHGWIVGNRHGGRCNGCQKKIKHLRSRRCVWCGTVSHDECVNKDSSECHLGPLRDHILPPWAIYSVLKEKSQVENNVAKYVTPDGHILQIVPNPSIHPLLVFVNPKSGGKQGKRILRKFQHMLNPRQVFDLCNGGPAPGLNFFRDLQNYRILVCGGDGTVGWILDAIDKANLPVRPPVAVLPLGTGNDLARCLRWGGGYDGTDLAQILKDIELSSCVPMDRWSVEVIPEDSQQEGDPVPYEIINNYFSIGVDASIAHRFHMMREKHPQKFNSRMKNKLRYLEFATSETISGTCKKLKEHLKIECCGTTLDLSGLSLEGVAVVNIPSMHGGSNMWGEPKKDTRGLAQTESLEAIFEPKALKVSPQDFSDKRVEVVGLQGAIEMGQIYTGLKSTRHRLAKTSQITIRTKKLLPMQIDGEPWLQPPCTIHITHKNQANMLMKDKERTQSHKKEPQST